MCRDKGVSMQDDSQAAADKHDTQRTSKERRGFLSFLSTILMGTGLAGSYGVFAAYAGRFLFPNSNGNKAWQFVSTLDSMTIGASRSYVTPAGQKVVVARQNEGDDAESFIALSSVCPHLGCAVHWESQNDRFFCPCHNGAFDALGKPTEGPPAQANQELTRFPLKVEKGLLYIEVAMESLGNPQGSQHG